MIVTLKRIHLKVCVSFCTDCTIIKQRQWLMTRRYAELKKISSLGFIIASLIDLFASMWVYIACKEASMRAKHFMCFNNSKSRPNVLLVNHISASQWPWVFSVLWLLCSDICLSTVCCCFCSLLWFCGGT